MNPDQQFQKRNEDRSFTGAERLSILTVRESEAHELDTE